MTLGVLLADDSMGGAYLSLDQLAADPELEQAVLDQDVAGAARVSVPDIHLLITNADDSVARHLARHPVVGRRC